MPTGIVAAVENTLLSKTGCCHAVILGTLLVLSLGVAATPTLERGLGPEPDSLDPQRARGLSAQQVIRDCFEGLMREDAAGDIVLGAAASVATSADGREFTFVLKPDLRYADGSPLLAADFVAAIARALDPRTAAPYADSLSMIEGAQARLAGDHAAQLGVRSIAGNLRFSLNQAMPSFPARLSLPVAMPSKLVQGQRIGSGPYRIVDQRAHSHIDLEKNLHYWDAARVAIDSVRYHVTEDAGLEAQRFLAGELHLTQTVPPGRQGDVRARFGATLHTAPAYGTFFLGFNVRRAPLDNRDLRAALVLAVDRDRIVRSITGLGETVATHLVPPGLGGVAPAWSEWTMAQRLEAAREHYRRAGYNATNPARLELRYNTSLLHRRTLLAVSLMWEEALGVQTILRNEEWKVFVGNRQAGLITQVFRAGWNADLPDALDFLQLYASHSSLNDSGYASMSFDAALAGLNQSDSNERARSLSAAERLLSDDFALLPLYFYSTKRLISPAMAPFSLNPLDRQPSASLRFVKQTP